MNQETTISRTFTLPQLARFVSAPILTRFLISLLCTLDDGLFISRYCGEYSLAAFSLLMPYFTAIGAFGSLLSGVSSLCSIRLGEQKKTEAQSVFTSMVLFSLIFGIIVMALLFLFKNRFLRLLGATEILLPYADAYLSVALTYIPLLFSSCVFERFFTIAGKPQVLAFISTAQTFTNFFFDWLFMVRMRMGLAGTAYSNLISNILIFVISILFFLNQKQQFRFGKPVKKFLPVIKETFIFGRAEFLSSVALCVTSYILNRVLLNLGAETTLAAYAIVNTIQNMLLSTFSALLASVSPIISYAYGEKNNSKLKRIIHQTLWLLTGLFVLDTVVFLIFKEPLIDLYLIASSSSTIRQSVALGMAVIPFVLPLFGFNAMVQSLAVSVGRHKISLALSLIENVLFANLSVLLIPYFFGADAVWLCFLSREIATFLFCWISYKKIAKLN